jgi:hypothetical protein
VETRTARRGVVLGTVLDGWCVVRWEMGQDGVPSFGNGLKRVFLFRAVLDDMWSVGGVEGVEFSSNLLGSFVSFCLRSLHIKFHSFAVTHPTQGNPAIGRQPFQPRSLHRALIRGPAGGVVPARALQPAGRRRP